MKRKMIGAAAAYMSGLFFASFFTKGSDLLLIAGLLPIFFIIAAFVKLPRRDSMMLAVFFMLAYAAGAAYNQLVYEKVIAYSGKSGSFCGEIVDAEYYDESKALYIIDGRINNDQTAKVTYYGDAYDVNIGDVISLENSTFALPDSDYLFDAVNYYKADRIFLTAESAEGVKIEHKDSRKFQRAINSYRDEIISDFMIELGEAKGGFLSGVVFGVTDNIEDTSKTLLYRCGIGHVMAVSGLHVSIIAALLMLLLNKMRVNRYVSFGILNIFLLLMIIMVKYPVSAIRAAVMLDLMYAGKIFRRQNDSLNSLSAAVLLMCLVNPYVIFDRGFLLSISGTFGIAVFAPYMTRNMKEESFIQKFIKSTVSMLCVMVSLIPLSVFYFEETSVLSPLTNVVIIPFCVCAMIVGVIYVISGGLISLLSIADITAEAVLIATDILGRIEAFHFSSGNMRMFAIAAVCSGVVILVYALLRSRRLTAITASAAAAVFFFSSAIYSSIERSKLKAVILGRGANAAVVISHNGKTDVIDLSGHHKSPDYVRKYLASNGISAVNSLTLTEDIQSQYSAYAKSLELVKIDTIIAAGDSSGSADVLPSALTLGGSTFTIESEDYIIEYDGGTLEISAGELTVSIVSAKSEADDNSDLIVRYGNITKSTAIFTDRRNIYLDETEAADAAFSGYNNFEIEISAESGECFIRRL